MSTQTFITPVVQGTIEHDPNGADVQVHEVGDEAYLTFSDSFLQESGWKLGDEVVWEITQDNSLSVSNPQAEKRKALRAKVDELAKGGPEL